MLYHLKHAFTLGHKSYDAQILYARQLFLAGEFGQSKELFRLLHVAKVRHELKTKLLYPLKDTFHGRVVRKEATYCIISRDFTQDSDLRSLSKHRTRCMEKGDKRFPRRVSDRLFICWGEWF